MLTAATFAKLRWWLMFNLILVGLVITYMTGGIHFLDDADKSKISLVTLGVFLIATAFVGRLTMALRHNDNLGEQHSKQVEALWFISELLMGLGIVGTVLGIIMTFGNDINSFNFADAEAVKKATLSMSKSLTQAFVTTLVGMSTSLLLKLQLVNLDLGRTKV